MRRLIWLPIAGFLLIAGAALAAAASAPSATPTKLANQDTSSPQPSAATSPSSDPGANPGTDPNTAPVMGPDGAPGMGFGFGHAFVTGGADLVDQVLSDLVKAGTITQAQSDAITQGLQQAITDLCEVLGIELTPERRAQIERLDLAQLAELRVHLKSTRTWLPGT